MQMIKEAVVRGLKSLHNRM